ncbi:MAG: hypothetical protein ABR502_10555 [Chitinophagaceae bacterium]
MEYEILKFLFDQNSADWIKLNPLLKEQYGDENCNNIRETLYNLIKSGKIVVKDNAQRGMCNMQSIPSIDPYKNSQATLDNWDLFAMIKEPGKKEIRIIEAQTKQEKLTDAQINASQKMQVTGQGILLWEYYY